MRGAALVLVALTLVLPACGRKAPPVRPELVRPEQPENLSAIVTPDGVRLTWLRSLRYSGGGRMNDLGGFLIERAPGEGGPPEFRKVGTVTVEDQDRFRKERRMEWLDKDVRPGDRYLYRVIAETLDGYKSPPAGPVSVQFGPGPSAPPAAPQ
jgi:hypothetical protein